MSTIDIATSRQIFDAIARSLPASFGSLVLSFAKRGNIDMLEVILKERLIDIEKGSDLYVSYGILPLLAVIDTHRSQKLIKDWLNVYGGKNKVTMCDYLLGCATPEVVRGLLRAGADMNREYPDEYGFPAKSIIGNAIGRKDKEVVLAMLDHAVEVDIVPMQNKNSSIFAHLAGVGKLLVEDEFALSVMDYLETKPLTDNFRFRIGRGLIAATAPRGPKHSTSSHYLSTERISGFDRRRTALHMNMMRMAKCSPEDWLTLLSQGRTPQAYACFLMQNNGLMKEQLEIVNNLVRDQVDLNALDAECSESSSCSALAAALYMGHVPMVKLLLEGGANPERWNAGLPEGCLVSNFPNGSASMEVLASWRARATIADVIANRTRNSPKTA